MTSPKVCSGGVPVLQLEPARYNDSPTRAIFVCASSFGEEEDDFEPVPVGEVAVRNAGSTWEIRPILYFFCLNTLF